MSEQIRKPSKGVSKSKVAATKTPPPVEEGLKRLQLLRLSLEYDVSRNEYFIRGRDEDGVMMEFRDPDPIQILTDFEMDLP